MIKDTGNSNVFDIRAAQLEKASPILAVALEEIWNDYGLDICLTLMAWYSAKGILYSDLTKEQRDSTLEKVKRSLDTCYAVIQNEQLDTDN